MMYYIAMSVEQVRTSGGRWVTGDILSKSEGGFEFSGFNQPVRASKHDGGMQVRYVVLDYSGIGGTLYSTHALEAVHTDGQTGGLKYLGRSIHFAGSTPYTDSSCWFTPYFACSGGDSTRTVLITLHYINHCTCVLNLTFCFVFFNRTRYGDYILSFASVHHISCRRSLL